MLAGLHRRDGDERVPVVGGGDQHRVHRRVGHDLAPVGDGAAALLLVEVVDLFGERDASAAPFLLPVLVVPVRGGVLHGVARHDHAHALVPEEAVHVAHAHRAAADDGEVERLRRRWTPPARRADVKGSAASAHGGQRTCRNELSSCFHF